MPNGDEKKNDIGLRIENAILKSQQEVIKHNTEENEKLRKSIEDKFDRLPCKGHEAKLEEVGASVEIK